VDYCKQPSTRQVACPLPPPTGVEQLAAEAGYLLHHIVHYANGACTKYFVRPDMQLVYGCWDAHKNFYWTIARQARR